MPLEFDVLEGDDWPECGSTVTVTGMPGVVPGTSGNEPGAAWSWPDAVLTHEGGIGDYQFTTTFQVTAEAFELSAGATIPGAVTISATWDESQGGFCMSRTIDLAIGGTCSEEELELIPGDRMSASPGEEVAFALGIAADPIPGTTCVVDWWLDSVGLSPVEPTTGVSWQGSTRVPEGGATIPLSVHLPVDFIGEGRLRASGSLPGSLALQTLGAGSPAVQPVEVDVLSPSCPCSFGSLDGVPLVLGGQTEALSVELNNRSSSETCQYDLIWQKNLGTPTAVAGLPSQGQHVRTKKLNPSSSTTLDALVFQTTQNVLVADFVAGGTLRAEAVDAIGTCDVDIIHCVIPAGETSEYAGTPFYSSSSAFNLAMQPATNWGAAGGDVEMAREVLRDLKGDESCSRFVDDDIQLCTDQESNINAFALRAIPPSHTDSIGLGTSNVNAVFSGLALVATATQTEQYGCLCQARQEMEFRCKIPSRVDRWVPYQANQIQKGARVEAVNQPDLRQSLIENARLHCGVDELCVGEASYSAPDAGELRVTSDWMSFPFSNWP